MTIKAPVDHLLIASDGWLAPDGRFASCFYNEAKSIKEYTNGHEDTARRIIHNMSHWQQARAMKWDDTHDYTRAQEYLLRKGWMRIDIEDITIWKTPTEWQLQTLEKMLGMPDQFGGFCRDCARKILSQS